MVFVEEVARTEERGPRGVDHKCGQHDHGREWQFPPLVGAKRWDVWSTPPSTELDLGDGYVVDSHLVLLLNGPVRSRIQLQTSANLLPAEVA